jgi:hypothetical protein
MLEELGFFEQVPQANGYLLVIAILICGTLGFVFFDGFS